MFNLLPEKIKEAIRVDYKYRRLLTILFFVVCVEVSFLIFLLPTWVSVKYKEDGMVTQSEQMTKFSDKDINPTTNLIKSLNGKLQTINSALEYPRFIPLLQAIINEKTSAISITQVNFLSADDVSADIGVSGVSSTRESLVSFVKKLEETKLFKEVNSPISNLAKDKNIVFNIVLKIAPAQ